MRSMCSAAVANVPIPPSSHFVVYLNDVTVELVYLNDKGVSTDVKQQDAAMAALLIAAEENNEPLMFEVQTLVDTVITISLTNDPSSRWEILIKETTNKIDRFFDTRDGYHMTVAMAGGDSFSNSDVSQAMEDSYHRVQQQGGFLADRQAFSRSGDAVFSYEAQLRNWQTYPTATDLGELMDALWKFVNGYREGKWVGSYVQVFEGKDVIMTMKLEGARLGAAPSAMWSPSIPSNSTVQEVTKRHLWKTVKNA